jgi:hypothetical protein
MSYLLYHREGALGTCRIWGWVGPRVGLDISVKRNFFAPATIQTMEGLVKNKIHAEMV